MCLKGLFSSTKVSGYHSRDSTRCVLSYTVKYFTSCPFSVEPEHLALQHPNARPAQASKIRLCLPMVRRHLEVLLDTLAPVARTGMRHPRYLHNMVERNR
jgi:hypothetical protein